MTNGLLLGKFMPFHKGHEYMINFARNHCEKLIVMVCSRSDEPIDGRLRYAWIRATFPDVIVKHVTDDTLPQDPSDPGWTEGDFRACWINEAKIAADGMKIDYYYASESYGHWMADGLGAEYVPVDPKRWVFPVSGTDVRNSDIYGKWDYLPLAVRKHYAKRVCLIGPESTGKTTLAKCLADRFNTVWVPEYGRIYTDEFGGDGLVMKDFERIRKGHEASRNALLESANRIIIEDTDALMTAAWCEALTGSRWFGYGNPWTPADLYLLCRPNIDWIYDGTRYFEDAKPREEMFDRLWSTMLSRGYNYRLVDKIDYIGREIQAVHHVSSFIEDLTST